MGSMSNRDYTIERQSRVRDLHLLHIWRRVLELIILHRNQREIPLSSGFCYVVVLALLEEAVHNIMQTDCDLCLKQ